MKRSLLGLATLIVLTPTLFAQEPLKLAAESEYYPLKVGSTWEYKSDNKTIIVTVEKLEKVGEEVCAKLVSKIKDDKDNKTRTEHVTVRSDGVYRVKYQDNNIDPVLRFLALPLPQKEPWKIEAKMFNVTLKGEGTVAEKLEKGVKTEAGEYEAVVSTTTLTADKSTIKITYYFVKDIGIVKQVAEINGKSVSQELVKYTAGK